MPVIFGCAVSWAAIGASASVVSMLYTIYEGEVSYNQMQRRLEEIQESVNQLLDGQQAIFHALNKLPNIIERTINSALVDQTYSFFEPYYIQYSQLASEAERSNFLELNRPRILELFSYIIDNENRPDGLLKMAPFAEKIYLMFSGDRRGLDVMISKYGAKAVNIQDFCEKVAQEQSRETGLIESSLLKHRYVRRHNFTKEMNPDDFELEFRKGWVRDCISPGEADFLAPYVDTQKSSWHCPPPYIHLEGPAFHDRFRRITGAIRSRIDDSILQTKSLMTHKTILESVYVPYREKLIRHRENLANGP